MIGALPMTASAVACSQDFPRWVGVDIEYSFWIAATGCSAWARRAAVAGKRCCGGKRRGFPPPRKTATVGAAVTAPGETCSRRAHVVRLCREGGERRVGQTLSEAMSMTKRYLTSLFSMRS